MKTATTKTAALAGAGATSLVISGESVAENVLRANPQVHSPVIPLNTPLKPSLQLPVGGRYGNTPNNFLQEAIREVTQVAHRPV